MQIRKSAPSSFLRSDKVGFITGRFQLFHNGHLEYALQAKAEVDFLIIGICNPDIENLRRNPTNAFRHLPTHNPFNYWERFLMIERTLFHLGLSCSEFAIVPCPINEPRLIANYIPTVAKHFTRIYDRWGEEKVRILLELGYENQTLYKTLSGNKKRSSSLPIAGFGARGQLLIEEGQDVRRRLLQDNDWQIFVPQGTAEVAEELNLVAKLV